MASPAQQAPPAIDNPSPDVVGNAFVHQYYLILHQSPELVHRFYQDVSKLGRPDENGAMTFTTTMEAINAKILSFDYGGFTAEISTVDAQESYDGGVIVLVTGYLTVQESPRRKFTQSFFLAPQDKGYFVLNDLFRYVNDAKISEEFANDVEAPLTPDQTVSPPVHDNPASPLEVVIEEKEYKPSENGDGSIVEEEAPVPQVVHETPNESHLAVESISKVEDVPKKSYASILKVIKARAAPVSTTKAPPKPVSNIREQQTPVEPSAVVHETPIPSNTNAIAVENVNNQDGEAEGPSIYIKGLPSNATPALLEIEFNKFGPIKPGGIQVRSQKGFCFGFVEFESATAVQSAIEASPINIGGRRAVVEEKRSTSRGNGRARFSSGPGAGYRSEGGRGRSNNNYVGGRGYGRNEFGNRNEYGNRSNNNNNRGGFHNRGGDRDGYQRTENGGGRMNRANGVPFNAAAAKTVAPNVSAPA